VRHLRAPGPARPGLRAGAARGPLPARRGRARAPPARRQLPRARRRGARARHATPRGLGPRARALAHPGARRAPPAGARRAAAAGHPRSADELRRLLEAGAKIGQGSGASAGGGLPITALVGKLPAAQLAALRRALGDAEPAAARRAPVPARDDHAFFYDEWDHLIGDYRSRWCRLTEVGLAGDAGEFFGRTLADYARLLPEVRRQFQRIRPEMYRSIRGLEDGEDFD